jgi:septum formation protein
MLKFEKKLILASQSPRRKHLLESIGLDFEIIPAHIDESSDSDVPEVIVKHLAYEKAYEIEKRIDYPAIIISADTIVVLEDEILNKPKDSDDAFIMLKKLSNRTHRVLTGITIIDKSDNDSKYIIDFEETKVTFRELSDSEIFDYIKSGSPMDKAGAYGIQDDFGSVFVKRIEGCFYNVVGLPIQMLYLHLIKLKNNSLK